MHKVQRILIAGTVLSAVAWLQAAEAEIGNSDPDKGVRPFAGRSAMLLAEAAEPESKPGAALADFTMISGFDLDITQAIPNGALVEVDPTGERPFIRIV